MFWRNFTYSFRNILSATEIFFPYPSNAPPTSSISLLEMFQSDKYVCLGGAYVCGSIDWSLLKSGDVCSAELSQSTKEASTNPMTVSFPTFLDLLLWRTGSTTVSVRSLKELCVS